MNRLKTIILVWAILSLMLGLLLDGVPRKEPKYRFKEEFIDVVISLAILYWAGAFD